MFELMDTDGSTSANIKVIGLGGGGGNAVRNMIESGIEGIEFLCANTDAQALQGTGVEIALQLGSALTKGLGAGANPEVGRESALEDRETIRDLLMGTDMLFITAGMGGGTGTGAAPVVAQIARELDILTVAVVTKPFPFEGAKRMRLAEDGIIELCKHVDSLITIPNAKLLTSLDKNITLLDAFKAANDVLLSAVQGISDLITNSGLINVDFADVKAVMSGMGVSMMGTGVASGSERATEAAQAAVSSPLLDDIDLKGAQGILVNITGGMDMGIHEFEEVGEVIRHFASDDAIVVVGNVVDPEISDEIRVTLVATGLDSVKEEKVKKPVAGQRAHLRSVSVDVPQKVRGSEAAPAGNRGYEGNNQGNQGNQGNSGAGYLDIPSFLRSQTDDK
ncbi:MAG TPA: cell division protein FtsZ [Thiothrix sp.]|nr:cell division protein FtsZ [Thiothrix sp.]